jgi:hypothetical protein
MSLLARSCLPRGLAFTALRSPALARTMAQSADVQLKLKEAFLKQPRFAVVGASKVRPAVSPVLVVSHAQCDSQDQSKWGTKVRRSRLRSRSVLTALADPAVV